MIESSDILSEILIAFSTYTSPFRYNFRCFDRDPNSVLTLQHLSLVGTNTVFLHSANTGYSWYLSEQTSECSPKVFLTAHLSMCLYALSTHRSRSYTSLSHIEYCRVDFILYLHIIYYRCAITVHESALSQIALYICAICTCR